MGSLNISPEQHLQTTKKVQRIIDSIGGQIEFEDLQEIKIALHKMLSPKEKETQLYERYIDYKPMNTPQSQKSVIKKSIKRITGKYPELFKAVRDASIVDIQGIMKDMNDLARNTQGETEDKNRIGAAALLFKVALEAEKMAGRTKEIEELSVEGEIGDKTYQAIIDEIRGPDKKIIDITPEEKNGESSTPKENK